ncbi:hypothetical protein PanWU01x14_100730, partial [Parasponia andersonii]
KKRFGWNHRCKVRSKGWEGPGPWPCFQGTNWETAHAKCQVHATRGGTHCSPS